MFNILLLIIPRKAKPARRKKLQQFDCLKGKAKSIELFLPSRPNKEMTTAVKLPGKQDFYLSFLIW